MIDREGFLAIFHAVVLADIQAIIFELRNVVVFFNHASNLPDFLVAVAVDQSEPFDLVVYLLGREFA